MLDGRPPSKFLFLFSSAFPHAKATICAATFFYPSVRLRRIHRRGSRLPAWNGQSGRRAEIRAAEFDKRAVLQLM